MHLNCRAPRLLRLEKQGTPRSEGKLTKVSIGIPAYNEERSIPQLLSTLLEQPTQGFAVKEIIVNTSGSADNTEQEVQTIAQMDSRIKMISRKDRYGKAAALNEILQITKSDLILFLDADVVLGKMSIQNLVTPLLQNDKTGVSSGNIMPIEQNDQESFFGFASLFIRELHHELCSYLMRKGHVPKVNGTFYAFRKSIVDSFPRIVVSDDEYVSWLAQKKGYKIVYAPGALVFTTDPHSLIDFIKWQERIIAGQLYMKRHFHYDVPTMRISVGLSGGIVKLFSKYRGKAFSLFVLSALGALSVFLAYLKLVKGEVPYAY